MIAMLAGTSQPIGARAPVVLAQTDGNGVFGFGRDEWDASFTFVEEQTDGLRSGGTLVYQLNDSSNLYVRLGDQGDTIYVEYELWGALSFNEAEAFVVDKLLPGDAEFTGQYRDVLLGSASPITVQLYVSNTVASSFSDSSGIILVAYRQDGQSFSLSVE